MKISFHAIFKVLVPHIGGSGKTCKFFIVISLANLKVRNQPQSSTVLNSYKKCMHGFLIQTNGREKGRRLFS